MRCESTHTTRVAGAGTFTVQCENHAGHSDQHKYAYRVWPNEKTGGHLMFIDTDTVADVRYIVARALREKINNINGDLAAHKQGSTSIVPKSQIRRKSIELKGALEVYMAVYHYGDAEGFEQNLLDAANEARLAVDSLYAKN